jgi:hypothetical protein
LIDVGKIKEKGEIKEKEGVNRKKEKRNKREEVRNVREERRENAFIALPDLVCVGVPL